MRSATVPPFSIWQYFRKMKHGEKVNVPKAYLFVNGAIVCALVAYR